MLAFGELLPALQAGPRDAFATGSAALLTIASWWASTAGILWLLRAPQVRGAAAARFACALIAAAAVNGIVVSAWALTTGRVYAAFACALLLWGLFELLFLQGVLTGPMRDPCPPHLGGWPRFRRASATVIHHELAIFVSIVLVAAATYFEPNRLALATLLALWLMRLSAKLNLFLGVREHAESLLRPEMAYLASYFRRRRMNAFWPLSVLALTAACTYEAAAAFRAVGAEASSHSLLATLLALGLLEHLFLVLPLRAERLWRWTAARDAIDSRR